MAINQNAEETECSRSEHVVSSISTCNRDSRAGAFAWAQALIKVCRGTVFFSFAVVLQMFPRRAVFDGVRRNGVFLILAAVL